MRWKMPLIKSLVQKAFYNHGVKTNFSKLVLDEISESNERKKIADSNMQYFDMSALFSCLNSVFSVWHWKCTGKSLQLIGLLPEITNCSFYMRFSFN